MIEQLMFWRDRDKYEQETEENAGPHPGGGSAAGASGCAVGT